MGDKRTLFESLQVVVIYTTLAALWILFSDQLLALFVDDPATMTRLQTVKGILFVLTTAGLLYFLVRRMERRLKLYDERYRSMFFSNPLPMWIYDLETLQVLLVNQAAQIQYGYSKEKFLELSIKDLRPHEYIPQLLEAVQAATRKPGFQTNSGPWRHQRKDGSLLWVEIDSHTLLYNDHPAERIVARDITKDLEAQEILRLNAEVFDNSREGIMVTDSENRIIMVNRAFEKITGYAQHEVLGRNPNILNSGQQDMEFYASMWQELKHRGQWSGEVWNQHKDGHQFPERLSISTICDNGGNVEKYIGIFSDTSDEKEAQARINFLAHFDPLTNLPNRSTLIKELDAFIREPDRDYHDLAVLALDLDRFKHINDGLGYEVGNRLLIEISQRLTRLARGQDSVYRQSGDEFSIVLPGYSVQRAAQFADDVLASISAPFDADGQEVSFTGSIGIAHAPQDGNNAETLLQRADAALSRAKSAGRNSYQFYDEGAQNRSLEYMQIEHGLRKAISNGELLLYYQPQYDAKTQEICGFEALIRWQHPEWGLVSPGQFIPVAEESGQIIELGQWVISSACQQIREWQHDYDLNVPVAINISVIQFRRSELYQQIVDALAAEDVHARQLCLEITESIAMEGGEQSIQTIEKLHGLGCSIAIDDFGSGYSSLNYLKHLKVDKLKIDKGFIHDISNDPRDAAIVKAVIELAHSLDFSTIAEGVESEAEYEALRKMGCDEIQGFYFARPLPRAEINQLLEVSRPARAGSQR